MAIWEIVLLVLVVLVALLFVGGYAGNARARAAGERRLTRRIEEADRALAQAHSDDRGWDADALRAAAQVALEARRPGVRPDRLELVQVVDRPGVDEDRAVFHAVTEHGAERIELVRTGGSWRAGCASRIGVSRSA